MKLPRAHLSPNPKNKKKNALKKLIYYLNKSFCYILGNGTSLYFLKRIFLIFPAIEPSNPKNKKFRR